MTTATQQPLGTGFSPATTTAEVLADLDLSGQTAIVTGGYSGLGLASTRALAGAGAEVWVPARRIGLAHRELASIPHVNAVECDLADPAGIVRFAREFLTARTTVDLMINAAGIMAAPERFVGRGWESHFATNYLGHFALVQHLWPAIARRGARVVNYSSAGHHLSSIRWEDKNFSRGYDRWLAYGQSKTANALHAVELNSRGRDYGVTAYSLHPGSILTPLQRHMGPTEMVERGWIDEQGRGIDKTFKTPDQGAATGLWAATSAQLDNVGGVYCEDCDIASVRDDGPMEKGGVRSYAIDPEAAYRLWQISAHETGVR